jgi:hypothetical protein
MSVIAVMSMYWKCSLRACPLLLLACSFLLYGVTPAFAATVTFHTDPAGVGSFTVGGSTYYDDQAASLAPGDYGLSVSVPSDYRLVWVVGDQNPGCGSNPSPPGICVLDIGANPTTMRVGASGTVTVTFAVVITFRTSTGTGSITYGSSDTYTDGQTREEGNHPYSVSITANPPDVGHPFLSWTTSGSLSVLSSPSNPTTLTVNGPGTLTANFQGGRQWTFMVYVAYDNDLSREHKNLANSLLTRLQSVGSTAGVDVVVLIDKFGENTAYYHIESGGRTQRLDYPLTGDIDTTSYSNLKTFITWTVSQYPASRYLLDLHNHGDGIAYILKDEHGPKGKSTSMSMQSLQRALIEAGQKIDVLFFHACLMGMIEVADVLWYSTLAYGPPRTNAVDYMVASENTMPFRAAPADVYFPYGEVLTALTSNPDMNGKTLSQTIVDQARTFYGTSGSVTLSAIELNGADPNKNFGALLWDSMNLADALQENMGTYKNQIKSALKATNYFFEAEWHYVDLYQFASNVKTYVPDSSIQSLADQVMAHITDPSGPIIANYAGSGKSFAHGLSVYVPKSQEKKDWAEQTVGEIYNYNKDYDALDFSRGTYWNGFVRSYYGMFDFRVDISPSARDVAAGGSTTFTVSVTLVSGSAMSEPEVELSVRRIDPASQTSFLFDGVSTKKGRAPFSSILTVNVGSSAATSTYSFFVYAISGKLTRQVLAFIVVSGGATTKAADDPPLFQVSESNGITGSESWAPLPGATLASPSTAVDGDTMCFSVRGTDSRIYVAKLQRSSLDFYMWTPLTGATSSAPSVAVSGSTMYIAVRGTDNGIYWSTVDVGSGSQTTWRRLTGATSGGPSVAVSGSTMYIAVRGTDNGIYWSTVDVGSGSQTTWRRMSGATASSPAIAMSGSTMYIAVRGTDNGIYVNSIYVPSETYLDWGRMDGATLDTPSLALAMDDAGTISLVLMGTDNGIYFDTIIAWESVV